MWHTCMQAGTHEWDQMPLQLLQGAFGLSITALLWLGDQWCTSMMHMRARIERQRFIFTHRSLFRRRPRLKGNWPFIYKESCFLRNATAINPNSNRSRDEIHMSIWTLSRLWQGSWTAHLLCLSLWLHTMVCSKSNNKLCSQDITAGFIQTRPFIHGISGKVKGWGHRMSTGAWRWLINLSAKLLAIFTREEIYVNNSGLKNNGDVIKDNICNVRHAAWFGLVETLKK